MLVTRELREKFERQGYIIFDPEVSETILDGILDDLKDRYGRSETDIYSPDSRRIQDAWRISNNVKTLALAPKPLALLEELYGCKPLPFQTLNFRVGTEQRPHSDALVFNSMPSGYMCGIWVALEDIDLDNGPLVYYPGSHQLPEVTIEHINKAVPPAADFYTTEDLYSRYEQLVDLRIARFELRPEYGVIEKGKALLWSANLLHGGALHYDKSRTRYSQVTHYFFEGCRYYTPIHSRGNEVYWRYPTWITDDDTQASSQPTPGNVLHRTTAYEGCHDITSLKVISGWAWDSNRPNASVNVDIYAGSDLLATVIANEFRADVANHTRDNGCHGFSFGTPSHLGSNGTHIVTVKIAETDIVLSNSPQNMSECAE